MPKPQLIAELEKELDCIFESVDLDEIMGYNPLKAAEYSTNENGNITGIAICRFELKEIPEIFTQCNTLSKLNLGINQIRNIETLSGFKTLTALDLSDNEISDISTLSELKFIRQLWLDQNQIIDISPLKGFQNIQVLSLHSNQISDISPLKELRNMQALYLWSNKINDISALKDLKNLQTLGLRNNPVKYLEAWIVDFPEMDIRWGDYTKDHFITFYENPIENIPIEIIKQGKEDVKEWFEQQNINF